MTEIVPEQQEIVDRIDVPVASIAYLTGASDEKKGNIQEVLLELLRHDKQGTVTTSGYILEINNIVKRTAGQIAENMFDGTVVYTVLYNASIVHLPVGKIISDCAIVNVKDSGVTAKKDNYIKIFLNISDTTSEYLRKDITKLDIEILSIESYQGSKIINVIGKIFGTREDYVTVCDNIEQSHKHLLNISIPHKTGGTFDVKKFTKEQKIMGSTIAYSKLFERTMINLNELSETEIDPAKFTFYKNLLTNYYALRLEYKGVLPFIEICNRFKLNSETNIGLFNFSPDGEKQLAQFVRKNGVRINDKKGVGTGVKLDLIFGMGASTGGKGAGPSVGPSVGTSAKELIRKWTTPDQSLLDADTANILSCVYRQNKSGTLVFKTVGIPKVVNILVHLYQEVYIYKPQTSCVLEPTFYIICQRFFDESDPGKIFKDVNINTLPVMAAIIPYSKTILNRFVDYMTIIYKYVKSGVDNPLYIKMLNEQDEQITKTFKEYVGLVNA